MKTIFNSFARCLIPACFAIFPISPSAATTIIDSTTLNGSFEDGTGTGIGSTIDLWQPSLNPAANVQEQRIDNNASDGTYSAVIGYDDDLNTDLATGLLLNTGHKVGAGETYDLSFDWIPLFRWQSTDEVIWRLFTTSDDTTSGTVTEIASGTITGFANGAGYKNYDFNGIGAVVAANVGRDLWIEFDQNNAVEGEREFSRIDNVVLASIPGPASPALLGFTYDPTDGSAEVSIAGAANTAYILVEADDLDFSNPDQNPIPLTGASVGTLDGNEVTTDAIGHATVQFNLGTAKDATFLRAETAP
ncbi:hypothetical protein [Haloferula sp. A504]|uniref:hypothetical protein n=1 Tax=Haloferula sp. A504 TaxID=3373601 RepID=UPI0031CB1430|nr:hypothetical protein [Verrucomicrobiaceae bacterium E54]